MFASTTDSLNRGPQGPRRRVNRGTSDRRRGRLRELCDEVLASYRLAQGQDVISEPERNEAEQVLRKITRLK
jgi:hypothetical protein